MTKFDRFSEVTWEVHRLIGITPVPPLGNDARWTTDLELDDVPLAITYCPSVDPNRFALVCPFGDIDHRFRDEIMYSLLRLNFRLSLDGTASFSINPATGEVLFIVHIELARTDSQAVLTALLDTTQQAKEWRSTYFLNRDVNAEEAFSVYAAAMRA